MTTTTESKTALITESVRALYEKFPYPHYPLWLPLKVSNGTYASSSFAAQLFKMQTGQVASIMQPGEQFCPRDNIILIGGCGDTLPYIVRRLEPRAHHMLCVDLSEANIKRARRRHLFQLGRSRFVTADLETFMSKEGKVAGPYDHIDLYGVLHHMANPLSFLQMITRSLHPQGTMRLMLYNSEARRWIRDWQKIFRTLQLSYTSSNDVAAAKNLLELTATLAPGLAARLKRMPHTLVSPHRFADCFLHTREAALSISQWFAGIEESGLQILGVLDPCGELDDLPNPLIHAPTAAQLEERAKDYRYENNLILYLAKAAPSPSKQQLPHGSHQPSLKKQFLQSPPLSWFDFPETKQLNFWKRQLLWREHLHTLASGPQSRPLPQFISSLKEETIKRLARLGVISPSSYGDAAFSEMCAQPICQSMDAPALEKQCETFQNTAASRRVMELLQRKNIFSERRFFAVMERMHRSQS